METMETDPIWDVSRKCGLKLTKATDALLMDSLMALPDPPELPQCLQRKLTSVAALKQLALPTFFLQKRNENSATEAVVEETAKNISVGSGDNRENGTKKNSPTAAVGSGDNKENETNKNRPTASVDFSAVRVNIVMGGKKVRKYECTGCKKRMTTKAAIISHINTAHIPLDLVCPKCHFKTSNPDCFTQHVKNCGRKSLQCELCSFRTTKLFNMKRHSQYHKRMKSWFCDTCQRGYTSKEGLRRHQRNCKGDRRY